MFDFVSKADFKAEYTLRIQAEAREQVLREQNAELTRQLGEAQTAYRDLVTRLHPDPATRPPIFDAALARTEQLSAAEILRMPATGRRGLAERQRLYGEALKREEEERAEGARSERRKDLSPEEERELETVLSPNGSGA
jgi:hypothetical protein